ncbi:hypothetical protein GCM10008955_37530 [Deinococcus malanensis]|uniref:Uncharacterized protein n=2 Tax=Deinococcus malanensis TaxID=1706855 RepID=A0ABQ2F4I7_9DEIO|nr:hypothetical protein GCM10008955_37530 [Deinococcus malanensis]
MARHKKRFNDMPPDKLRAAQNQNVHATSLSPAAGYAAIMKVRFTARGVRVRIDDLELAALQRGEALTVRVTWEGGGWSLILDPQADGVIGSGAQLAAGLRQRLPELLDPAQEGVTLQGPVRVDVEKDFGPQHLDLQETAPS